MSAFSQKITQLIDDRFSSRRAFIRAAETGETTDKTKENRANAYLAKVLNGERPPPLDRVSLWFNALNLNDKETQYMHDLAAIAHLPLDLQPRFVAMLGQLQTFEATQDDILLRLKRLEADRK